jgi:meiotically up-regulated gene 157 (Mug157) protein
LVEAVNVGNLIPHHLFIFMKRHPDRRPSPAKRCFTSPAIEKVIIDISSRIKDPELAWLFANCFPNTLDTTVDHGTDAKGKPDTFVITGDIDAMWLRDSTNQVWPYLAFVKKDPALARLIEGVVRRQTRCVLLDPYANAFFKDGTRESEWKSDKTEMRPGVHERKYELDSLCAVLRLSCGYHAATDDTAPFDAKWIRAVRLIIDTIEAQQAGLGEPDYAAYSFARSGIQPIDTVPFGCGHPAARCGLSKSPFRPSDDAHHLPFLIPANAMAVVFLRKTARLLRQVKAPATVANRAEKLASEISTAIAKHAVVQHPELGSIYAYEIDGFGSQYLMDDANVPSLLSLPYLGFVSADNPFYQRTRKFILSSRNPYFFEGRAGQGVGGPHVGQGYIWPMALVMQALTSTDLKEIAHCLSLLKRCHGGTGLMHETFWKDDPKKFTRSWFAWANTIFGELIVTLDRDRPEFLSCRVF